MDSNTDQTKFWLAWHATCAAVDCTDASILERKCKEQSNPKKYDEVLADIPGTVRLASEMIKSTNFKFKKALHYFLNDLYGKRRNSDYADEVAGWQDDVPGQGCAFAVLESHLYAKETLEGRPFKDYLFEDVGCRPGGLSANVCGYINKMLRTIAKKSFSKTYRIEEHENDEGEKLEFQDLSTENRPDFSSLSPRLRRDVNEVVEFFGKYVDELGSPDGDDPAAWDQDHWISIYCALHEVPINNPEVRALCRRGKSMLAETYRQTVGNLLLVLRKRLKASDRAIAWAMEGGVQSVLGEKMRGMPFYADLERIRKSRLKKNSDEAENAR